MRIKLLSGAFGLALLAALVMPILPSQGHAEAGGCGEYGQNVALSAGILGGLGDSASSGAQNENEPGLAYEVGVGQALACD